MGAVERATQVHQLGRAFKEDPRGTMVLVREVLNSPRICR
jgi:hypothetical protein